MAEFAGTIIGLAATDVQIGDALYKVIGKFKDAPDDFLGPSNEITDFRLIVARLKDIIEMPLSEEDVKAHL